MADCILDRRLFSSPNWNWRYGGVRYIPDKQTDPEPSKILVLQWPGTLGDVAMSAPVFSILRQKYPHAEISFLSGKTAQYIFMGNPDIDVLMDNPLDPYLEKVMHGRSIDLEALLRDISSLVELLTKNEYILLVNLQVLPMSAVLAKLSGAKHTIGMTLTPDGMPVIHGNIWAAYLFGVSASLMRRYNLLHRTEIFNLMIDEQGRFIPDSTLYINHEAAENVQAFFDHHRIKDEDLVVGINPMAGTPIRKWGHYDQLAKRIKDELGAKVIVFGAKAEEDKVDEIVRRAGKDVIKATQFNLQELMAAICGCDLFITNDTGPMHLACLLKRKVIALFGPTSFQEVGPWQTEFHVLQSSLCRDCYKQVCPYPEKYCMNQIKLEDVFKVVEKVVKGELVADIGDHLIYRSSKDIDPREAEDAFLGQMIFQVFKVKGQGIERAPERPPEAFRETEGLMKEYSHVKSMVKKAINYFNMPASVNLQKLQEIHQSIESVDEILKPIVVINALEFLDRRIPLKENLDAYRNFYDSLLKDLEIMMSCISAQPKKAVRFGQDEKRGQATLPMDDNKDSIPMIAEIHHHPLISVHMIVWNQEKYIGDAIRSVLDQTYQNYELIIVDDGSTDNTRQIIETFRSDKIKYHLKEHSGVVASRNYACDKCAGDYIAFLDSDDMYEPTMLEKEVATLLRNPDLDVVYTNLKIIDENGNETGAVWTYKDYESQELIPALFRAGQNITPFPSMMVTKRISDKAGGFDSDFIINEDSVYTAKLAKHGKFKHINLPLYKYRRHGSNISHRRSSLKERSASTALMLTKMLEMFSKEEIFPEIHWAAMPDKAKEAEFNFQVARVFWEHCKAYLTHECHHNLLEGANTFLGKCLTVDPTHRGGINLAKELNSLSETIQDRSGEAPTKVEEKVESTKHKLRILYLADCRSQHTKRYVCFFKDRGHEVHIFDTSEHGEGLEGIQLHFPQTPQNDESNDKYEDLFIQRVFQLNSLIDRIKPDILHGHYLTERCWWGALTGFQPYVLTCWGSDIFLDTKLNDFNRRFSEFCLKTSPLVTADSMDLLRASTNLRGFSDGVKYIPFGIDVELFRPGLDTSSLAKKLGINGLRVVLSPRQFRPPANIDVLIKAIPKIISKIPNTVFILKNYLGEGTAYEEYKKYLHDLVKELNVESHVTFMDNVSFDEMPILYNLADVMVTLRDTDGSSCSMLESMSCKTPVVASDIESMREWIMDGENGRIVNQNDPDSVADAISEILLDDEKRRKFQEASHAIVCQKADYRKNWLEMEQLYYEVSQKSIEGPLSSGFPDSDISIIYGNLRTGWHSIASHNLDKGREAFAKILEASQLTAHSYMRALIGLARIAWIKGDTKEAKAYYMGCLKLLQGFELDTRLDIKG